MELASIPTPSGRMSGSLASPRNDGQRPAVIVIHEVFGLNADMQGKAQRLADMGYVALVPDLYSTRGRMPFCVVLTVRGLRDGEGPVFADLDACRKWLANRPEVDESRIGVMGFCLGGGIALLFAARAEIGAAAVFYGAVPKDVEALDGTCPVVAGFGGRDRVFGKGERLLKSHLRELNVAGDVKTYPGAGHSYMSDHRGFLAKVNSWGPMKVGYNPADAEDSWQRVERFFAEHLGGSAL